MFQAIYYPIDTNPVNITIGIIWFGAGSIEQIFIVGSNKWSPAC